MTRTVALVWKEWRETRWFLIFGLLVFNLFPAFEAIERGWRDGRYYSDIGEGMVLGLGGLLAIIVAVAVTCRDLRGGIDTFWQSRPITVRRLLAAKYFMGLLVVLAVTVVTLLAQMIMSMVFTQWHVARAIFDSFTSSVLYCHTPTLILIFSLAFMIGTLVRQAVPATMLSIAAALLVYFLPLLIPPLGFASVINILVDANGHHYRGFPVMYGIHGAFFRTMLLVSLAAAIIAVVAVRHDWRLRADLRLLCWTLGGVVLLLLATSAYQLRSNLTCEKQISVTSRTQTIDSPSEYGMEPYEAFLQSDGRGILAFMHFGGVDRPTSLALFDLSKPDGGLRTIVPPSEKIIVLGPPPIVASPDRPDRAYVLLDEGKYANTTVWRWNRKRVTLLTVAIDKPEQEAVLHHLDLTDAVGSCREMSRLAMIHDKLYLLTINTNGTTWKVTVIDASYPDAPVIDKTSAANQAALQAQYGTVTPGPPSDRARALDLVMVPLPGLSARDRVALSVQLDLPGWSEERLALDGDLLVRSDRDGLTTYRVTFEGDAARFRELGTIKPPPLLRLLGLPWRLAVRNGRAYTIDRNLGDVVTVYDISQPERPRRLGHYAQADRRFYDLAPLPGNRLLVAGNDLTILKTP